MFEKLKQFRQKRYVAGKEQANSIVVYVLLFPVLFGAFGVSVDLAIGTYTNTNLQSGLDTATQSALSRAVNPGTGGNVTANPRLTEEQTRDYIIDFYDTNRTDTANSNENPFLRCQTTANESGVLVTPPSGCGWTENSYTFNISGNVLETSIEVYEVSAPVFITLFGIEEIKYTITSSARTTFATN